jgi:L-ribulose-5-phosphate 3-epimerase
MKGSRHMHSLTRRTFLTAASAAGIAALHRRTAAAQPDDLKGRIRKAVKYHMIQEDVSVKEKLQIIRDIGYEGVEPRVSEKVDRDELRAAARETGIEIHGVVNGSVENIPAAIDLAVFYGASSVLVCAGRVNEATSYADNYRITQEKIREALPYAAEKKIPLLLENVWNYFLLSPLEMARYIDELESEYFGAYYDVGNTARFGWPAHWIPVLGKRIRKIDIKPYSRKKQFEEGPWNGFKVLLGDGDIDWKAVRTELNAIGYAGWATAEVPGGNREYLADLAKRMDAVLGL